MHIQIHSQCDGWNMQVIEGNKVVKSFVWDHEDYEEGVGGEKVFAKLLNYLGHRTYQEEVY